MGDENYIGSRVIEDMFVSLVFLKLLSLEEMVIFVKINKIK